MRVVTGDPSCRRGAGAPGAAATTAAGRRAWSALAVGGLVLVAGHALGVPPGVEEATFLVASVVTIAAIPLGVRAHGPAVRWPWALAAAGVVLFLAGGAARVATGTLGDLTSGRAVFPDLLTLPGYALLAGGLVGLAVSRRGNPAHDLDALLDGLLAALAAFALAWVFLINPALGKDDVPLSVRLLLACYPTMSVLLVALTAHLAFTARRPPSPAHRLLLAAMVAMLVGDVAYMVVDARMLSLPTRLVDVPYALAYLAFSLCVLHPSMRQLTAPAQEHEAVPGRARLVLVALSLSLPTVVLLSHRSTRPADREVLATVVGALTVVAVWRIFRALDAQARSQARFAHQATHDALTGLPNRLLLHEHLERLVQRQLRRSPTVAVLFLDVDRFKLVNDSGGHKLGDELLVAIAERLRADLGPGDLVARLGGDEFVIVLRQVADGAAALAAAEGVRRSFERPFTIRGAHVYASASVGVALAGPGSDPESLVRDADTAMYQAKAAGRDGSALFDSSMRDRVAARLQLEQDLRAALADGQLRVDYQPVVRLDDGRVVGCEALVRWEHPGIGSVPPSEFIPIAEETGLIAEIGAWVVEEACAALAEWRRATPEAADVYVAVNLSARQLRDPGVGRVVGRAMARRQLGAGSLCLELTESSLMDDPGSAAHVLRGLRAAGVRLSLDDFGTGYSSLAYLQRFPVDEVKIDRSFVEGLGERVGAGDSLVRAIVSMAEALGMDTVAEGVETPAEVDRLVALGVGRGQGYLFCRPVGAQRVPEVLTGVARSPWPAALGTG